jgi:LysR family glycine cleavage system transcriptional activator
MFRDLPAMHLLRAFEASARCGSFTAAAAELGLTQGAVSQNVKALEQQVGRSLFRRHSRGNELTSDGRQLLEGVCDALERLGAALRSTAADRTLTVSVLPGFAVKWLFPRLIRFDQQYPEIEVSITTTAQLLTFNNGEADISIRYGRGSYPGLTVERLLDESMFPVCSPGLLADHPPLRSVEDLTHHLLLHDEVKEIDGIQPGWTSWFRQVGVTPPKIPNNRRFGQSNMVIQAAIEGIGVALGRSPLTSDDLLSGQLVRPFGAAVPSGFSYYLVYPPTALESSKVRVFRDWLLGESRQVLPLPPPVRS